MRRGRQFLLSVAIASCGCASVVGLDELQGRTDAPTEEWVRHFSGTAYQAVTSVAMDGDGRVIVAGVFDGSVAVLSGDIEMERLDAVQGRDFFIVAFTPTGDVAWSKVLADARDGAPVGLAVTREGDVVVSGYASGKIDFGDGVVLDSNSADDAFAVKLGPSGNAVWLWHAGGDGSQRARAVAASPDGTGDVWVVGNFEGKYVVDPHQQGPEVTSAGGWDGFVARLDTHDGRQLWGATYGDAGDQHVATVSATGTDAVIAGTNEGTITVDGQQLTSHGSSDMFLVRLGPLGELRHAASFGDVQSNCFSWCELAVHAQRDDLTLVGAYAGSADFGGGAHITSVLADGFAAGFDGPAATHRYSMVFGDALEQRLYAVAAYGDDRVASGFFNGAFSVGEFDLVDDETFAKDVMVIGLARDGEPLWTEVWPNEAPEPDPDERVGPRVAARADHGVAVGGAFRGSLQIRDQALTAAGDFDGFVAKLKPPRSE